MSSYDAIAELYDPWSASVVEDVAFYLEEARRSGGPVVELGVGTGRIAVPIAADGIRVIGVDSSRGMLEVCARRAALAGVDVDLRVGDLREPPVAERVPLVICPFRSLLHMHTDEDRRRVLESARELLVPGGRFVFDVFAPGAKDIEQTHDRWLEREPGIFERAVWDEVDADADADRARRGHGDDDGTRLAGAGGVARSPGTSRLRDRGVLRLVRPHPVRGRRGHGLDHPPDVTPAAASWTFSRGPVQQTCPSPGSPLRLAGLLHRSGVSWGLTRMLAHQCHAGTGPRRTMQGPCKDSG